MKPPEHIFGRNNEEEYKKYLEESKKKPEVKEAETPQPERAIVPVSDISKPEDYIILEGRTHGSYSYPNLLVARERTHHNNDWNKTQEILYNEGNFMLTIRQYVDFLNLLKSGKAVYDGVGNKMNPQALTKILKEIEEVRSHYRAEWLDAKFRKQSKFLGLRSELVIEYQHRFVNGQLKPFCSEPLEDCLMQDKTPGIDLEDWLQNATSHGLPKPDSKQGSLYYWHPRDGNVARFSADSVGTGLDCYRSPRDSDAGLGVRPARVASAKI